MTDKPTPIVIVGSSAGGLGALKAFFDNIPTACDAAFLVVQHLDKSFASSLNQLLAKVTTRPIHIAKEGDQLSPGHIYVQPKGYTIGLSEGHIQLQAIDKSGPLQFPINVLFESASALTNHKIVAVVLSGSGSDGARALGLLQDVGALTIAQKPETAEFTGMPQTAIDTGHVDFVLPPEHMGQAIESFFNRVSPLKHAAESFPDAHMETLYQQLITETGVDFRVYKPTTLLRRLDRRMAIHKLEHLSEYVNLINVNANELPALAKDLLIGVTSFVRDPDSFEALKEAITERLQTHWSEKKELRVWVTCCSTGQEAYSIGMILLDTIKSLGLDINIKIFATDVEAGAIKQASEGVYSELDIAGLPQEWKDTYFHATETGWRIRSRLRERVVIAHHNLLKDPPFSNMDLVTCRNMMIYLMHEAQRRALAALHFSMSGHSLLMLGRSENARELEQCFETIDDRAKIFSRINAGRLPLDNITPPRPAQLQPRDITVKPNDFDDNRVVKELVLHLFDQFAPASIVVDDQGDIAHVFGDISAFTQPLRPGRFSPNMSNIMHADLSVALFAALKRAKGEQKEIEYRYVMMDGQSDRASIRVIPFADRVTQQRLFLVVFGVDEDKLNTNKPRHDSLRFDEVELARERIQFLESEVHRQGESLQVTVEELETTNEELQAANEELTVSNEELQSTNEELQSVNEELYSVNSEYEDKIRELSDVNESLDQIMRATAIGILTLNAEGHVQNFTESVTNFVRLIDSDVGRPITDVRHSLIYPNMSDDMASVMTTGKHVERVVVDDKGDSILIRISAIGATQGGDMVMTFTPLAAKTP